MAALELIVGFSLILPLSTCLYIFTTPDHRESLTAYGVIILTSLFAYKATDKLIPVVKEFTLKAGLKGRDINKKGTPAGEKDVYIFSILD